MKRKGIAVVASLFGASIALIGSYYTIRGSLSASMIATVGAAIMAYVFSKLEKGPS